MFLTRRNKITGIYFTKILFVVFSVLCSFNSSAQDDLLKMLQTDTPSKKEKVIATFKSDKVINIETNETVKKNNLDFRVNHLFGNIGKEGGGGVHDLYGLDQSADIRIGFHYGVTDKLMVGISHVKRNENLQGLVKYRALEQSAEGGMPFAVTLYGNTTYSIRSKESVIKDIYRLTYCAQAIFARKFSSKFSLIIAPGFVHRNFVGADDENNTFSLSGGFRCKFTPSASIIADYSHTFGRKDLATNNYDVAGIGLEIETGGHVFSIMFTNASGILENDFLLNNEDSWTKGGFKLSFIISRMFHFGSRDADSDNAGKKN